LCGKKFYRPNNCDKKSNNLCKRAGAYPSGAPSKEVLAYKIQARLEIFSNNKQITAIKVLWVHNYNHRIYYRCGITPIKGFIGTGLRSHILKHEQLLICPLKG
jgi:hypothetical protein